MNTRKIAVCAFNGDTMWFVHALLNALEMREKGHEVKLIIEGGATAQIRDLVGKNSPPAKLYSQAKGMIDCVCQACAFNTGALDSAREQGLPICSEMRGHPSLNRYMEEGFEVLIF